MKCQQNLTLQERKEQERLRSAKRRAEKKQTGSSNERTFESTFVVTAPKNTKLGATQSRKANSPAPTADSRKREPAEKSHRIESRRGDLRTGPESNLTQFDLWGQPVQRQVAPKSTVQEETATPDQTTEPNTPLDHINKNPNVNAKKQSTGKKPSPTTAQLTLQERKEKERLRGAKRQAEKKQKGQCRTCSAPAVPGRTQCKDCAGKNRDRMNASNTKKRADKKAPTRAGALT